MLLNKSEIRHSGGFKQANGLPQWLSGTESACNAGDTGLITGSERSTGGEQGDPLQYACLGESDGQRSLVAYSS